MSGSITLHPKKGVNAHLGICSKCGKDNGEILLVGIQDGIYECCGTTYYGKPDKGKCPKCGTHVERVRTLEDGEKIPSSLCDECKKEAEEHCKIVEAGGVFFRCVDCGAAGVIKANEFTKQVREAHQRMEAERRKAKLVEGWFTEPIHVKGNEKVHLLCGIEFTKKDCPKCGPDAVA